MATGIPLWDTNSVMRTLGILSTNQDTVARYDGLRRIAERMIYSYVKWPIVGLSGSVDYYDGSSYKDLVLRHPFTSNVTSVHLDNTGAGGQNPNSFPDPALVAGTDYMLVTDLGYGGLPGTGQASKSALLRRMTANTFFFPSDLVYFRNAGGLSYRWPAVWPAGYGNVKVVSNWGFVSTLAITSITWLNGTATVTTASPHLLWQGQDSVSISGVLPAGYNGDYVVQGIVDSTNFTIAVPTNPGSYSSGGAISSIPFDVLGALVQIVGIIRNSTKWGGLINNESGGDWNGSLSIGMDPLFGTVRQMLSPYRNVAMVPTGI